MTVITRIRLDYVAAALLLLASPAAAQESRVYAGGTAGWLTQTHSATEPLGGTTFGASAIAGVWLTPRVAVEVEPAFGPAYSWQYSYRPGPSLVANVVASRRDTFVVFQVRTRFGKVQPVVGVAYTHGHIARHATFQNGASYFDDEASDNGVAVATGLDAPVQVAPHLSVFPMVRLLIVMRPGGDAPLESQTSTGALVLRYGGGIAVTF